MFYVFINLPMPEEREFIFYENNRRLHMYYEVFVSTATSIWKIHSNSLGSQANETIFGLGVPSNI